MISKEQIVRVVDPDEIDALQYKKNETPVRGLIRRTWVEASNGAGGNRSMPYWFPAVGRANIAVNRKEPQYNRTDHVYKTMLTHLPNKNARGLEIMSDIGRSTGFLTTVTKRIDVVEEAVEWIDLYDVQSRNIARRLGHTGSKDADIRWHFGTDFYKGKYDWVKIEFDKVDSTVVRAIQCLKPTGKIILLGSKEQCRIWAQRPWAEKLKYTMSESPYGAKGKNSFICFSINTNGENND